MLLPVFVSSIVSPISLYTVKVNGTCFCVGTKANWYFPGAHCKLFPQLCYLGILVTTHVPQWDERRDRGCGSANPAAYSNLEVKNECVSRRTSPQLSVPVFHKILVTHKPL